jgi:regulator of sigma E protease
MSGMIDESMDTEMSGADYEFNSKPVWKRIIIITAGVIMNFFLAVVIMSYLSYSMGESITPFTQIGQVGKDGISKKIGFEVGDDILAVNGVEVESWEQIQQEYIRNLNSDIVFTVERDSRMIDLVFKKEWFSEKNAEFLDIWYMPTSQIGNVQPDMPAGQVGLETGDKIIELDNTPINNWLEMTEVIRAHPGDSIQIAWLRADKIMQAVIVPQKFEETDASGEEIIVGKIGVQHYYQLKPISPGRSIVVGFERTIGLIGLNMRGLWWVLTGTKSAKEVVGGPIMIAKMAGDAAAAGWEAYWTLIAALSAILAFFNILPIPALDGGHLAFLIIEGVIGKPLSIKTRMVIQQVGMALLLTLLVFILYVDLRRLFF